MVSIFTGASFGMERGSAALLGGAGLLGGAAQGRGNEGIFVNAATGNLLLQKQDEFLVGKGPDVSIGRTYNSLTTLGDDNGDKWRQNTDRRVYGLTGTLNTAGSTIKRVSGDGTEILYTWTSTWSNGTGAYVTKDGAGAYDAIVYDGGTSEWVWTDGDTQLEERYYDLAATFGRGGFLKTVKDTNGLTVTYAYEASSSRLSTVTTSDGSWTRYDWYAGTNNIEKIVTGYTDLQTSTAKTLTRTRYTYDGSNRLSTVTTDLSPEDNSVATGGKYVITYGYDGSGRVNSITQSDGSSMTITYDGSGRVWTLVQTASTGVTRTTTMAYSAGFTTVTDATGQVTRLDYDANGNLTKITAPPAYSGAAQQVVEFGYNANGDVTSTKDALLNTTSFSNFTVDGLAQTITDRLSNSVTRVFGSIRRSDGAVFVYSSGTPNAYTSDSVYITNVLLSETANGIDTTGASVSQTTRYAYDSAGNLRFAITAEGRVTEYEYNASGQRIAELEYAESTYTTTGNPTAATMTTWRTGLTDKSWVQRTDYQYDARGNLQKSLRYTLNATSGAGSTADGVEENNYIYDQAGQLLSTNVTGRTATTYVYDGMGRLTATTDINGGTTNIVFTDTAGSITTVATTASGYVTTRTYNKAGDLVSFTDSGTNTVGGTTTYEYDALGRVRVTTDATSLKTYTIYDNAGRHVGDVDSAGFLTEYRYDANNRLVGSIAFHTAISGANLTTLANPNNTLSIVSLRPANHAEDTSSWTVYDAEGRVLQTILGDGSTAISTYDASGRLQKTTSYFNKVAGATVTGFVTTAPTALVTVTADSAKDAVARYFYDKDGLLIGTLDGEGYLIKNSYDSAGMLVATTAYATITLLANRAAGSFSTLLSNVGTSTLDRTTRYVYDSRGNLRFTVDAYNQITRYDYDIGNLQTTKTEYAAAMSATSDYTYDNVKSLTASLDANSANRRTFSVYDSAGRLAYRIMPQGGVVGYTYDNRGQVTRTVQYYSPYPTTTLPTKAAVDSYSTGQITHPLNRISRAWYTARGEAAYNVDGAGFVSRSDFNAMGQTVTLTTWANAISTSDSTTFAQVVTAVASAGATVTRSWQYDSLGRVTRAYDGKGVYTSYTYHGTTDLVNYTVVAANGSTQEQVTDHVIFDKAGRAINLYQAEGTSEQRLTTKVYDGKGNLSSIAEPLSHTTSYTYDLNGRVKTMVDAASGTTYYDYNQFGEVWKLTDPVGNITYSWYDKLGRLTTQRDAADFLTTTAYTVFSEIQSVKRWQTATTGTAVMTTEPTGSGSVATTSFTYTKEGSVLTSVDALSQTESYGYNLFGERISLTNRLNGLTTYDYDNRGLLTRESATGNGYNTAGSVVSTVLRTEYTFDARGNLASKTVGATSPAAIRTDYSYDANDRLIAETGDYVPLTGVGGKGTFDIRPTNSYVYDARGNVIAQSDPNGAMTLYWYDKLDRKTAELNAAGTLTNYGYDANGNLTSTKVFGDFLTTLPGGVRPDLPLDDHSPAAQVLRMYDLVFGSGYGVGLADVDDWVWRMANLTQYTNFVQPESVWSTDENLANDPYGAQFNRIQAVFAEWATAGFAFFAGTNSDFITRVYQNAFRRAPTTGEMNSWLANLSGGWTRAGMATLFTEHSDHRVATDAQIAKWARSLYTAAMGPTPVNASNYRQTTFTYDNLNRLKTSTIAGVATGSWNGTTYVTSTGPTHDPITTSYDYDADGNVLKITDPNGATTWAWYDKLNRKTAQLDGEKYITAWTYDAEGNVLTETRYANQFAGTPSYGTVPTVSTNANDRKTTYTYDANGNRKSETRAGVIAWNVDPATGALTAAGGTDAVISYNYNNIGQVIDKTVANVVTARYFYDNLGRMTSEQRASYTDANGTTNVTPSNAYLYDAAGHLVRQTQAGSNTGTYATVDRVTTYTYGAGGRLLTVTDAEGFTRSYGYDAAGNLVKDSYARRINTTSSSTSDWTTTSSEAILYQRDVLGRVVRQSSALNLGASGWNKLATQYTEYNAWGDVSRSGTNSNGSTILWQVTNQYDGAGRLTGTNSGDGVWKFFGYDKAGNQTALITSAGYAFTSSTGFASALSQATSNVNANATFTVFDKRGLATQVVEEGRERNTSAAENLTTSRTYNAFGEVATETNADSKTITYTYNTMGRLIRSESPMIYIKLENGGDNWIKPSEDYYYDLGGRRVASRDANGTYATGTSVSPTSKAANTGNLTTFALLAGTGYDGGQALVSTEFHSDGGKKQTLYDIMGDARVLRSELYDAGSPNAPFMFSQEQFYNRLGQLTQVKHERRTFTTDDSTRLADNYVYDQFGQRIQHTNSQFGGSYLEKNSYDALGRIVSQTDFENHVTTTTFTWDGTLATSGLATYGGWVELTNYVDASKQLTVKSDLYGREVYKSDLGGHVFTTAYDSGGRAASITTGSTTQTWLWYNTGLLKRSTGLSGTADYTYDKLGNRLTDVLVSGGETVKNATATYDALGRLTTYSQASGTYYNGTASYVSPDIQNLYFYDAVGNIRMTSSTHDALNGQGGVATADVVDSYWYRYDSMNRLIVDKGMLSGAAGAGGTTIVRRHPAVNWYGDSVDIEYNAAGQRTNVRRTNYTPPQSIPIFIPGYFQEVREIYQYGGDGLLTSISTTTGTMVLQTTNPSTGMPEPSGPVPVAPTTSPTLRSSFGYDYLGRLTSQTDQDGSASPYAYNRNATYNKIGQLTSEDVYTIKSDGKTYGSINNYSYYEGSGYLLGAVAQVDGVTTLTGVTNKNTKTVNSYLWYDGAVQSVIEVTADLTASSKIGRSDFTYNVFGQLTMVDVDTDTSAGTNARDRKIYFKNDVDGQILRRDEVDNAPSNGDPHEIWYRFNSRELSYIGNDGTDNLSENGSISDRRIVSGTGAFRNSLTTGLTYTDTSGGSYEALNSYNQGSVASGYVVQAAGENLRSVAMNLWGDSSLWYKLAEANGLQADSVLLEGQRLNVPAGVTRNTFNASTIKPYDANDAIGNVSPTSPKPKKPNKCGMFGQLLLTAIAIAVTVIALPGGAPTVLQGALAGLAGGAASQAVGVATGIQNKFDFKGIALSALSGAVTAGLGAEGVFGKGGLFGTEAASKGALGSIGSSAVRAGVNGAISSAISQGVGVATGLQSKFSWAGVAAAGVGAAVGEGISDKLDGFGIAGVRASASSFGNRLVSNTASAMANAATRSALLGTSFGDNLMRALPDAIGQTVGSLVAEAIYDANSPRAVIRELSEQDAVRQGLTPGSPEFKAYMTQNRGRDREFAAKIKDIQSRGNSGELFAGQDLISLTNDIGISYLGYTNEDIDEIDHITGGGTVIEDMDGLTGEWTSTISLDAHGTGIHSLIDPLVIKTGNLVRNGAQKLQDLMSKRPLVGMAITLLDIGLKIAGGPARYALGEAMERVGNEATSFLTERFSAVGYDQENAVSAGVGGPITLSAMVSGFGSALKLAGVFGGIRVRGAAKGAPIDALEGWGVRPAPGTRVIPEGIPEGWRIRPTREPGGVWYYDPKNKGNAVRVMQGQPGSPHPNSQNPYVRWQQNGAALDMNGNVVPKKTPDAHIPLDDFKFNPEIFK
jgi:YD repeat-containing protein